MHCRRLVLSMAGLVMAASAFGATPSDEQIIKYYRKKANVPPAQKVAVTGLKESSIKGVKEGNLEIGDGPGVRKVPFVMSADGRYAIFSSIEDVTVDPSKAVMEKINLK